MSGFHLDISRATQTSGTSKIKKTTSKIQSSQCLGLWIQALSSCWMCQVAWEQIRRSGLRLVGVKIFFVTVKNVYKHD